jgi:hypothetical protein
MSVSAIERAVTQYEQQDREAMANRVVGIGVLIILNEWANLDDSQLKILAVRQRESKPGTGKKAGSLSIVQETVKVDPISGVPETRDATLLGAMEEVTDATGVRKVGKHFRKVDHDERIEIPLLTLPGNDGGLEVVVYDRVLPYDLRPAAKNEIVGRPQWVPVEDFLDDPTARDTSLELVDFAVRKGLLTDGIDQHARGLTVPVFPRGYQFHKARQEREARPDITKFRR